MPMMQSVGWLDLWLWSGGQTGVDRGAHDAAIALGLPWGGWAPRGWRAEDGTIPERYRARMREHKSADYLPRTRANVLDTHATLILYRGKLTPGSRQTERIAERAHRPCRSIDLAELDETSAARQAAWMRSLLMNHKPLRLNVAGSRESKAHGIQVITEGFMVAVLEHLLG